VHFLLYPIFLENLQIFPVLLKEKSYIQKNQKLNYKIRMAQKEKVPYMIILGDKEESDQVISVRTRKGEVIYLFEILDFEF